MTTYIFSASICLLAVSIVVTNVSIYKMRKTVDMLMEDVLKQAQNQTVLMETVIVLIGALTNDGKEEQTDERLH